MCLMFQQRVLTNIKKKLNVGKRSVCVHRRKQSRCCWLLLLL